MKHLYYALQKWFDSNSQNLNDGVRIEYRLLCSGELYNLGACCPPHYIDYWRNPYLRLILDGLPGLFVTNEPHRKYPQELSFTFDCYMVEDSSDGSSEIYNNDQEIAEEFVSLLSVLTRRLICVFCKISEYHYNKEEMHGLPQYWPHQVYNVTNPRIWSVKSATLIYDGQDRPKIEGNMPLPVGIDISKLKQLLEAFSSLDESEAENFISAARLYKMALTFIEEEPEIAYLHLIFAIETIANFLYKDFVPDEVKQVEVKRNVKELAKHYDLTESQAKELALEACKGISWTKDKFIRFLVEYTDDSIFTEEDSLFHFPISLAPNEQNFEKTLAEIYKMRSKAGHEGCPFPPQVGVGTKPTVSIHAVTQFHRDFKKTGRGFVVPPAVWFERVVNLALITYAEHLTKVEKVVIPPEPKSYE
jgi:hypothetical protein